MREHNRVFPAFSFLRKKGFTARKNAGPSAKRDGILISMRSIQGCQRIFDT